jgi:protein-tyrosine phosphatase
VTGTFGADVEEFSEELARKRLVHVLASDAHNTRGRPPVLTASMARLGSWMGDDVARRMANEVPRSLLAGLDPEIPEPDEPAVRRRSLASRLFRRG